MLFVIHSVVVITFIFLFGGRGGGLMLEQFLCLLVLVCLVNFFVKLFVCFLLFSARCNIYISRAYATMSVSVCPSVCDGSALLSRCMPGRGDGLSRAMLATARSSCPYILYCRPT